MADTGHDGEDHAIIYDKLLAKIPDVEHSYGPKDCMLYALGLGLGYDPVDEDQLAFVYEKNLKVLPTMAVVIGHPGFWVKDLDTGIDWVTRRGGRIFRDAAPAADARRHRHQQDPRHRDHRQGRGQGRGALFRAHHRRQGDRRAHRDASLHTTFCRADGGFGGPPRQQPPPHPIPERAPDLVCDLPTRPEMALVYRLSADPNPLHADPAVAKAAGFPRPILHGLATYGVAGHALLKSLCGYDPAKLTAIAGRFSAPVFPGETIRTEMWRDGTVVSFRSRVVERDVVAINNGRAEIAL